MPAFLKNWKTAGIGFLIACGVVGKALYVGHFEGSDLTAILTALGLGVAADAKGPSL